MATVLVTGATGYIGSHTIVELLNAGKGTKRGSLQKQVIYM